jgi:hypothetical protein
MEDVKWSTAATLESKVLLASNCGIHELVMLSSLQDAILKDAVRARTFNDHSSFSFSKL